MPIFDVEYLKNGIKQRHCYSGTSYAVYRIIVSSVSNDLGWPIPRFLGLHVVQRSTSSNNYEGLPLRLSDLPVSSDVIVMQAVLAIAELLVSVYQDPQSQPFNF